MVDEYKQYSGPAIGPAPNLTKEQKDKNLNKSIKMFLDEPDPKYEQTFIDQSEYRSNPIYRKQVEQAKIQKLSCWI